MCMGAKAIDSLNDPMGRPPSLRPTVVALPCSPGLQPRRQFAWPHCAPAAVPTCVQTPTRVPGKDRPCLALALPAPNKRASVHRCSHRAARRYPSHARRWHSPPADMPSRHAPYILAVSLRRHTPQMGNIPLRHWCLRTVPHSPAPFPCAIRCRVDKNAPPINVTYLGMDGRLVS